MSTRAGVLAPRSLGEWNAYVEAGESREERRRRLAECPERWRSQVRRYYRQQGGAGEG